MEMSQCLHLMAVVFSCLLVATVWCDEEQQQHTDNDFSDIAASSSQLRKRSVGDLSPADDVVPFPAGFVADSDALDKRSSLFRFGKRGGLFRFGKRGSLFRFGKRGSLFRFGKRGSLFRFGKRDSDDDFAQDWEQVYPDAFLTDGDLKRTVKAFHWGRETEE